MSKFKAAFDVLVMEALETSKAKGWEKGNDGEAICMMHAELSEALEWNRQGNPPSDHIPPFTGEEEELADVIIRIAGYAAHRNLDVGGALEAKLNFNENRPYKHGGKLY